MSSEETETKYYYQLKNTNKMNLILFFRLITMSIFQKQVTHDKKSYIDEQMSYDNQLFYCPRIVCNDGWNISLQIHNGNYCESENGYRSFGHTMEKVEFGFLSEDDKDLHQYSEMYGNDRWDSETDTEIPFDASTFTSVGTGGMIPIDVIQEICDKNHGGIDWEQTISIERWIKFTTGK